MSMALLAANTTGRRCVAAANAGTTGAIERHDRAIDRAAADVRAALARCVSESRRLAVTCLPVRRTT